MKDLFYAELVSSYDDYITGKTLDYLLVMVKGDKTCTEIITDYPLPIVSFDNNGYGVCNLINIMGKRDKLQIIANYLRRHQDKKLFEETLRKEKRLSKR